MSRDRHQPQLDGGEPDYDDEPASTGRSAAASVEGGRGARLPKLRDDPRGRRSLTGLEFRRQRSR
jgi:hypothetical protein